VGAGSATPPRQFGRGVQDPCGEVERRGNRAGGIAGAVVSTVGAQSVAAPVLAELPKRRARPGVDGPDRRTSDVSEYQALDLTLAWITGDIQGGGMSADPTR